MTISSLSIGQVMNLIACMRTETDNRADVDPARSHGGEEGGRGHRAGVHLGTLLPPRPHFCCSPAHLQPPDPHLEHPDAGFVYSPRLQRVVTYRLSRGAGSSSGSETPSSSSNLKTSPTVRPQHGHALAEVSIKTGR